MPGTPLPVEIHDHDPGHELLHHPRMHVVFNENWANICDPDFAGGADNTGVDDTTGQEQAAVDALGAAGGTVYRPPGFYRRNGTVVPTPNLTGTLRFTGDERASVIQPNGTLPLYQPTATPGDTIKMLTWERFHVDASNFTGHYCLVHISSNQVDIAKIAVRHVTGANLAVDTGNIANVRWWVLISTNHTAAGQAQNTITDIEVQHIQFDNGNAGVEVGSFGAAGKDTNVVGDRIHIEHVHHNEGVVSPTTVAFSGVHVGGYMLVRTALVAHCEIEGGTDAAVEINNPHHVLVFDVKIRNSASYCFYTINFVAVAIELQQLTWRDCHVTIDDASVVEFYGFVCSEDANANAQGEIVIENSTYTRTNGLSFPDGVGEAIRMRSRPRAFKVRGFKIDIDTVSHTNAATVTFFCIVIWNATGATVFCDLVLVGIQMRITGTKVGGSGVLKIYGLLLRLTSGHFDIDRWNVDGHVSGIANASMVAITMGDITNSMEGTIDRVNFDAWGDDGNAATTSVAIQIASTATLTIPGKITISRVNTRALATTTTDFDINSTQRTKVTVDNPSCKRRSGLPNQFTVSTFHDGTSGYAGGFLEWQNGGTVEATAHTYGPWDGYFIVKGGTVTQILVKNNIADSYVDIGVTQGRIPLNNGETIKVVGSGALPTMTFQPRA